MENYVKKVLWGCTECKRWEDSDEDQQQNLVMLFKIKLDLIYWSLKVKI